jgi:hypothetical protein
VNWSNQRRLHGGDRSRSLIDKIQVRRENWSIAVENHADWMEQRVDIGHGV